MRLFKKKYEKCKMRSNVEIIKKMKNAQQCGHRKNCEKLKMRSNVPIGKEIRNAKCAAMWPSEKLKYIQNA